MATRLEKLLQKEAQLKAQIQQAKAAERALEKKRDTRRKILIGAAVMARVERGEWPDADLRMMMDGFLSRPNERELFGLDESGEAVADSAAGSKRSGASTERKGKASAGEEKRARKRVLPESAVDLENEFNL